MRKMVLLISLMLVLLSCDLFTGGGDVLSSQFEISDPGDVVLKGDTVVFYEEEADTAAKLAKSSKKVKDIGYDVILAAEIPSVNVDGDIVQANTIEIKGSTAYIAYNYAGEPFRGAIQIIDIGKKGEPEITEEIKLSSMDVNALYVDGSDLIFGGAADPDIWGFKSFVAKINTHKINVDDISASVTGLASHAVTGIAKKDGSFYVTVGAADGELIKLSDDFEEEYSLDLPDGRDVEEYRNGVIVIAGTTDSEEEHGKVVLVPDDDTTRTEMDILDFGSDYHKATIEIYDGSIGLLALSEAGMKIMDLSDESIVFEAENPDMPGGLPYTNSVSYDGNLIFSANGEWGFRVFYVSKNDFDQTQLAGYYPFEGLTDGLGQNYSANHVEYKSKHLFVASGSGGVQVFTLDKK